MKKRILLLVAICISNLFQAQIKYEVGESFRFDDKNEKDVKIVLKDNYNHYLLSVINIDGMLRQYEILVRKFDQKNHLVETFTKDFGKKDPATSKADVSFLHNYLGSFEINGGKVAVITENYSGKAKIKEIFKHVFDKATGKFETSLIVSYPIESLGKCGVTMVRKSENNNFIGIDYIKDGSKKEPEVNAITVLDANSLNVVWQKEEAINPEFVTQSLTMTNTGKAILLRSIRGFKKKNYLVSVSADKIEDKMFEEEIELKLSNPVAISIGNQDYLIAFNAPSKGFNGTDIQNIMLYDLEAGKIIKNNKIPDFNCVKGLVNANINNVTIQNNEIIIFEESIAELEIKPVLGAPTRWDKDYIFESATVFVLGFDGVLKTMKPINALNNRLAPNFHVYGMVNIKGKIYINLTNQNQRRTNGLYALNDAFTFDAANSFDFYDINTDDHRSSSMNQLVEYFADSNKLLITKLVNENQMNFVSITGLLK